MIAIDPSVRILIFPLASEGPLRTCNGAASRRFCRRFAEGTKNMSDGHTAPDDAHRWQCDAVAAGDLLIRTICESPKDHRGLFTARPHSAKARAPCDFVLTAPSLEELRKKLAHGLARMQRDPDDDPVIVEVWL